MASRKEFEMLFQLNAQTGGSFNSTFSRAQKELANLQKEIQTLSKTQSDISAYQKQQQAVEATKQKLATLQQQYDNIQKEIKETEGYSSSLQNKLLSKQQQIDKTSSSLQHQTDKLNQMGSALREAGVNTGNLTSESARLSNQMSTLKERQEAVAESAEEFGNASASAFSTVQSAIAAAGVAAAVKEVADAYKECIDIAADFQATMSTVEALSGATGGEMRQLNAYAKELGATTKFTAVESGEAMTYMGMAGWDAQEMMSGMDGVLQLAAASGEDLAMTSDIVTDNLTAFGLKASDTAHFSDVLAAAATNSNTSVSIMGETFKNCAALAGALDYSIEDVAVAVGLMANAGIKGSNAGTALKNVFNGLLGGVTLTSKAFGEVEYSAINADGTMKSFGETINDLRGYFDQMTGAEKMQNAEALAGQRAMAGFVSIMNSTDDDFKSLTENIKKCDGAASKMAKIKLDNLKGDITLMNSASDALKTTLGEMTNKELRGLTKMTTGLLGDVNGFVQANPVLVKSVGAFVGVLGAATAGMTAFSAISMVVKALDLASMFSVGAPIMLAVGAIAALTATVVGIADAYKEAQIAARRYGDEVSAAAEEYKKAMGQADELEQHISDWKTLNATISSGTASVDEVNAAKERLKENEQWLIDNYGIYMDNDNKVSEEEIQSLEKRNAELRETARLQAEIALYNAKEKYDDAKGAVGDKQEKRDSLSGETAQLIKEKNILEKHQARWSALMESGKYDAASYEEQAKMYTDAISAVNKDIQSLGLDYDFSGAGFAAVDSEIYSLTSTIDKNNQKINKYNEELLEYKESAVAYKKAARDIIGLTISDIPTSSLTEFAQVAQTIGQQAADAELGAAALKQYADQLTEAAHAAGLLPENQRISFDADGALNVLEELSEEASELDGQTIEIIADAKADAAYMKINGVRYKVLQYDDTTGVATLSADGKNATMQINLATGQVHQFDEEEAEAYLNANTNDFTSNVESAKSLLASVKDKTVTITSVFKSVYQEVKEKIGFASGTESAPQGPFWVGENGPELMWFRGGEKVLDAQRSAAYAKEHSAMSVDTAINREPVSAMFGNISNERPIELNVNFAIEGNATEETVARLENWSEKIRTIIRDELEEISENGKRGVYA